MIEMFQPLVAKAEAYARQGESALALRGLRKLPLDDFGELLLAVPAEYPALLELLPRMADEQVQTNWTGGSGHTLLRLSTAFVRSLIGASLAHVGPDLEGRHVLDFGCGWGRLMRLMLKYAQPDSLFGVDAWTESIDICRKDGVLGHLAVSDYIPDRLPFGETRFDLVYAFSVFTHLSEKTARRCLAAIRGRMTPRSLLAITIRPVEYWGFNNALDKGYTVGQLTHMHRQTGYAFFPHNRAPIDGEITYGDTSVSLDYVATSWTDWEIVGTDRNSVDSLQVLVFLRPR